MRRAAGIGLLVAMTGWAILGTVATFNLLPMWGFPYRPNPDLVDTVSDIEPWFGWSALLFFTAIVLALAIHGSRRPIKIVLRNTMSWAWCTCIWHSSHTSAPRS